jgi:hypothetical protein
MPGVLRGAFLRRLFRLTADAFGTTAPGRRGTGYSPNGYSRIPWILVRGPSARILDRYAAFTRGQAESVMRDRTRAAEAPRRLFNNAFSLGSRLRALLGVRRMQEAMDVARTLYRLIGVDFSGAAAGAVAARGALREKGTGCATGATACFTVSRCFFSAHYPPAVCRLISSLDAGLLAGLTDGGKMKFTERITEGSAACKGVIQ